MNEFLALPKLLRITIIVLPLLIAILFIIVWEIDKWFKENKMVIKLEWWHIIFIVLCFLSFQLGGHWAILNLKSNEPQIATWLNSTEQEQRALVNAPQVNISAKLEPKRGKK